MTTTDKDKTEKPAVVAAKPETKPVEEPKAKASDPESPAAVASRKAKAEAKPEAPYPSQAQLDAMREGREMNAAGGKSYKTR